MKTIKMHDATWGYSWDEEFPESPEEVHALCERDGCDMVDGVCRDCGRDVS